MRPTRSWSTCPPTCHRSGRRSPRSCGAAGIPVAHSDRHRLLRAVRAAVPDRRGDRSRRVRAPAAARSLYSRVPCSRWPRSAGAGRRRSLSGHAAGRHVHSAAGGGPRRGPGTRTLDGRAHHRPAPDRPACGCRRPPPMRPPCTSRSPSVRRRPRSPRQPNHSGVQSNPSLTGCSSTSIPPADRRRQTRGHLSRDSGRAARPSGRWWSTARSASRSAARAHRHDRDAIDDACVQAVQSAHVVR